MPGSLVLDSLQGLGRFGLDTLSALGRFGVFLGEALRWAVVPPFKVRQTLQRIWFVGFRSLSVILLTGAFTGMVLGLQGMLMLQRVGSEAFVGPLVAIALVRELGPVLAALMVTGRAGSALAAEIGVMRITEQIDALTVMALQPDAVPRRADARGGARRPPPPRLGLRRRRHLRRLSGGGEALRDVVRAPTSARSGPSSTPGDIWVGFWKALVFGLIITWVACYKGFNVGHGAEGVGRATTEAVVLASVLILVLDYLLGSVLP